jgi:adenylate cyclase
MASIGGTSDLAGKAPGGRRLIAVVYADMVGYSRLIGLDDSGTLRRLQTLRRALIDPAIREYGGQVVQTGGDSLLVAFDSIDGAVRCAVQVQQQVPVYDGDQLADRRIRFRIGINIGDVIPHGTDLHGEGVNIAARLEAACPVGGICVSRTVRDHVHNRLSLSFEPVGELRLKNIARPVEAFVVRLDRSAESNTDRMSDGLGSIRRKAWPRTRITFAVTFMAISICAIVVGRWWLNREPVAIPKTTEIAEVAESKNVEVSSLITSARLRERPSIAVLPFQNLSKDGDQYFSDGITEDIISALGRFSNLIVAAKAASFQFKDRNLPPAALGQLLDVRYLLEGAFADRWTAFA